MVRVGIPALTSRLSAARALPERSSTRLFLASIKWRTTSADVKEYAASRIECCAWSIARSTRRLALPSGEKPASGRQLPVVEAVGLFVVASPIQLPSKPAWAASGLSNASARLAQRRLDLISCL